MIHRFEVSRDDTIYQMSPDLARAGSDGLVCLYRDVTKHGDEAYSGIMLTRSSDRGRSWTDPTPFVEPAYIEADGFKYSGPRIDRLREGRLVALTNRVEGLTPPYGDRVTELFVSEDDGETWDGPTALPTDGFMPDFHERRTGPHAGRWVVTDQRVETVQTVADGDDETLHRIHQWYSDDEGATWTGPVRVVADPDLELCEPSVVELDDGTLACLLRENSARCLDLYKAFSNDDETWDGPYRHPVPGCYRPVGGVLDSGRVLIAYRFYQASKPWSGTWPDNQNTFLALSDQDSVRARRRGEARVRIRPLDYDPAETPDTGYTGWVQFDDGELYLVNYIVDDAPPTPVSKPANYDGPHTTDPKASIRGYSFRESDLLRSP